MTVTASRESAPLRALVVDDDMISRRIARAMLRDLGVVETVEAADGQEALARFRDAGGSFDIALCDLEMPGMDGVELLAQLGSERPGQSIILVSSLDRALVSAVEMLASANGLRVLGTLTKPLLRGRLETILAQLNARSSKLGARRAEESFCLEELREALHEHQFEPHYQPKIDIATGGLHGAEALLRWRHPELGLIPPGRFIPLAEETGIIVEMTWALLDRVLAQIAAWAETGLDVPVSVNITVGFLEELAVTENVTAMAAKHRVHPSRLVLELTESMATADLGAVVGNLVRLRMRGFGLSIDDFGTGYASMQQLSRIPFTELKIDRSFVGGAAERPQVSAILESSVLLGKRLGLTTIAEGVETAEELELVRNLGCDVAQGFYFSRALEAEAFRRWVDARAARPTEIPAEAVATDAD